LHPGILSLMWQCDLLVMTWQVHARVCASVSSVVTVKELFKEDENVFRADASGHTPGHSRRQQPFQEGTAAEA